MNTQMHNFLWLSFAILLGACCTSTFALDEETTHFSPNLGAGLRIKSSDPYTAVSLVSLSSDAAFVQIEFDLDIGGNANKTTGYLVFGGQSPSANPKLQIFSEGHFAVGPHQQEHFGPYNISGYTPATKSIYLVFVQSQLEGYLYSVSGDLEYCPDPDNAIANFSITSNPYPPVAGQQAYFYFTDRWQQIEYDLTYKDSSGSTIYPTQSGTLTRQSSQIISMSKTSPSNARSVEIEYRGKHDCSPYWSDWTLDTLTISPPPCNTIGSPGSVSIPTHIIENTPFSVNVSTINYATQYYVEIQSPSWNSGWQNSPYGISVPGQSQGSRNIRYKGRESASCPESAWSGWQPFTVNPAVTPVPVVSSFTTSDSCSGTTPYRMNFNVSASNSPSEYRLDINNDNASDMTKTTSSFYYDFPEGTFYPRIKACNGGGCSSNWTPLSSCTSVIVAPSCTNPSPPSFTEPTSWTVTADVNPIVISWTDTGQNYELSVDGSIEYSGSETSTSLYNMSVDNYTISLVAINNPGNCRSNPPTTATLIVNPIPTPIVTSFTTNTGCTGTEPFRPQFSATASNATRFEIDIDGDGDYEREFYDTSLNEIWPDDLNAGTYHPKIIACNGGGCSNPLALITCTSITVNPPPTPAPTITSFTVDACPTSAPFAVTFTATASYPPILEYEWNYGNGSPKVKTTTNTSPSASYDSPGPYTPKVRARNSAGWGDWVSLMNCSGILGAPLNTSDLAVIPLSQRSQPWANQNLGTCPNTSFGGWGCAVTALAMVFNYYEQGFTNPGTLNQCLIQSNGYSSGCLLSWANSNACAPSGVRYVSTSSSTGQFLDLVERELSARRPVIAKVYFPGRSWSMHFVVIIGVNSGVIRFADPWDGQIHDMPDGALGTYTLRRLYFYEGPAVSQAMDCGLVVSNLTETLIDDSDFPCFSKFGQYWWQVNNGGFNGGGFVYTYGINSNQPDSRSRWSFIVSSNGQYQIGVYIPQVSSLLTTNAPYRLYENNNEKAMFHVNQNSNKGRWATLGVFELRTGCNYIIELQDNSGDCYINSNSPRIIADAVRISPNPDDVLVASTDPYSGPALTSTELLPYQNPTADQTKISVSFSSFNNGFIDIPLDYPAQTVPIETMLYANDGFLQFTDETDRREAFERVLRDIVLQGAAEEQAFKDQKMSEALSLLLGAQIGEDWAEDLGDGLALVDVDLSSIRELIMSGSPTAGLAGFYMSSYWLFDHLWTVATVSAEIRTRNLALAVYNLIDMELLRVRISAMDAIIARTQFDAIDSAFADAWSNVKTQLRSEFVDRAEKFESFWQNPTLRNSLVVEDVLPSFVYWSISEGFKLAFKKLGFSSISSTGWGLVLTIALEIHQDTRTMRYSMADHIALCTVAFEVFGNTLSVPPTSLQTPEDHLALQDHLIRRYIQVIYGRIGTQYCDYLVTNISVSHLIFELFDEIFNLFGISDMTDHYRSARDQYRLFEQNASRVFQSETLSAVNSTCRKNAKVITGRLIPSIKSPDGYNGSKEILVVSGEPVRFDASLSFHSAGNQIIQYEWFFGDGQQQTTTSPYVEHYYLITGDINLTLTVDSGSDRISWKESFHLKSSIDHLEVTPPQLEVDSPLDGTSLIVTAYFTNGSSVDVTGDCDIFIMSTIGQSIDNEVVISQPGQGEILIDYQGRYLFNMPIEMDSVSPWKGCYMADADEDNVVGHWDLLYYVDRFAMGIDGNITASRVLEAVDCWAITGSIFDQATGGATRSVQPDFQITRNLECLGGDNYRVTLEVNNQGDWPNGVVISDMLPKGSEVLSSYPAYTRHFVEKEITWLFFGRARPSLITYELQIPSGITHLTGSLLYRSAGREEMIGIVDASSSIPKPRILLGGYWNTQLSTGIVGRATMFFYSNSETHSIQLFYAGEFLKTISYPAGTDWIFYTTEDPISMSSGRYLIEAMPINSVIYSLGQTWPYLTVE